MRGLKCIRMELGEPDEKGRRRPIEVPGSEFEMACDSVIMALGTSPNPLLRKATPDLEYSDRGGIVVKDDTVTTMKDGVFAGRRRRHRCGHRHQGDGRRQEGRGCHRRVHQEQVSTYVRSADIRRMSADRF